MASINLGISDELARRWKAAEPWERVRAADMARSAIRAALAKPSHEPTDQNLGELASKSGTKASAAENGLERAGDGVKS